MPPKRATGASSTKTDLKRTKDVSQDLADEQDDHDEEKQLTKKKPVPKPRKKTSSTADTGSSAVVRETESSKRSNSGNDNGIASNGIHNGNTKYASTSLVTASQKRQLRMEDMTKEEIAIALEDLQKKYKKLKYLRHTEAESHLDEYKSKLDEMTLSTENYRAQMEPQFNAALRSEILLRDTNEILNAKVRTLQRDLRDARDNLKQVEKDAKTRAKDASLNSVLTNPNLDQDSAMDASTVHLFEDMSGFSAEIYVNLQ
ncbi:hypothetical protein BGZ83_006363 [Gryganskiella cystojenkinii]|nr:hypothetical protein BGZ83_006363 [Gryganskiella cystojenkinii]